MNPVDKQAILGDFLTWWRDEFAVAHKSRVVALSSLSEFNINPFLWSYLAHNLRGKADARSLAEVLVLPRALGTSVNTIFGTRFQQFTTRYFQDTFGSTTPGIDVEFIDKIDGRKKYCQLKAGPNVINYDDVVTIKEHFGKARRLARTNSLQVSDTDYVFCLLYGEPEQNNAFIRSIELDYPVFTGKDFWHHFTGDEDFYNDLVQAVSEIANEFDMKETIEEAIEQLALSIKAKYPDLIE